VSDLHDNLNSALGAIDPGPAPVEAAMLAGKKIRNRRLAGAVAGAVAIVAVAVGCVPVLAHHAALPSPTTSKIQVTVNPPGPRSPAGTIASGLVGNEPWSAEVSKPGTTDCAFEGTNTAIVACNEAALGSGDPISLDGTGTGDGSAGTPDHPSFYIDFGQVQPDVAYARVALADGTVLTLHPVMLGGQHWVAFVVPLDVPTDSLTAYSRTGEIATAIPYQARDGSPMFQAWLRPGQAVPREFSGVFGSGTIGGQAWRATAHLGPWGTCLVYGGSSGCFDSSMHPATGAVFGSGSWIAGTAADSVSYLMITFKHGAAVRVGVTAIGPEKFWGVDFGKQSQAGARWTAYDAEGKPLASGSVF
jgi:hypothetical protein